MPDTRTTKPDACADVAARARQRGIPVDRRTAWGLAFENVDLYQDDVGAMLAGRV